MEDETALAKPPKYLMDTRQLLGVLPTLSFWNDKANWKHVRGPMAVLAAVVAVSVGVASLPWWVSGLVGGGAILLAVGCTERYVRGKVRRRRDALRAGEHGDTS